MKTKLLAISLLLFTSQVFSEEVKIIKEYKKWDHGTSATTYTVMCIDNYKYLYSYGVHGHPDIEIDESTIQMFEERDGKSLPVRCN